MKIKSYYSTTLVLKSIPSELREKTKSYFYVSSLTSYHALHSVNSMWYQFYFSSSTLPRPFLSRCLCLAFHSSNKTASFFSSIKCVLLSHTFPDNFTENKALHSCSAVSWMIMAVISLNKNLPWFIWLVSPVSPTSTYDLWDSGLYQSFYSLAAGLSNISYVYPIFKYLLDEVIMEQINVQRTR